jgi:3-methylcrotonyl-CoA carboxylase alpha subunit
VTEEITGQDLVEWQLRVASGEKLPKRQEELSINGWAMEARLYAEDPASGFLPSTGTLEHFELGESVRIDTGVEEGSVISPFYDPMIAKIIATGETRGDAIAALTAALDESEVWPVKTNAAFLAEAASHPEFVAGDVDTGFIPRHIDTLVPSTVPDDTIWNFAGVAMRELAGTDDEAAGGDPWQALDGFRLNRPEDRRVALSHGGETRVIDQDGPVEFAAASATLAHDKLLVFYQGQTFVFDWPGRGGGAGAGAAADGALISPMPGKIIAVEVRQGDVVAKGQKLLTLEAMKMEHSLAAPFDGVVAELNAAEGGQVSEGALLARIDKD